MTEAEQAKREAMANYTAGALLLPKELFYNDLMSHKFFETKSKWKRVRIAKKLAKKYEVDVLLVIKRIKEIKMLYSIEE
ncbi:MAG: hypothetical protein IJ419_08240 [Agathobacter sp.]|nr:hypothetical protein [Agathobacter sp.]